MEHKLLLIRVDGSKTIGGGHIMRDLAVADAWAQKGGMVMFASAELPEELQEKVCSHGHSVKHIPAVRGTSEDAKITKELALKEEVSAMILDGYCFNEEYHAQIMNNLYSLAVYDDHGHISSYRSDILINQNIHAKPEFYKGKVTNSKLLLGPKFAAIRHDFLDIKRKVKGDDYKKVILSLGLSNTTKIITQVLDVLEQFQILNLEIEVLSSGNDIAELKKNITKDRQNIKLIEFDEQFATRLNNSDIAILAGGGTALEASYLGLPMILICIAENQSPAYLEFVNSGVALGGGYAENFNFEKFHSVMDEYLTKPDLRKNMSMKAYNTVDGKGAIRVAEEIMCSIH